MNDVTVGRVIDTKCFNQCIVRKMQTPVIFSSDVVTDCYRRVSFGSSSFSEVQGMGELGCIWKQRVRTVPVLPLTSAAALPACCSPNHSVCIVPACIKETKTASFLLYNQTQHLNMSFFDKKDRPLCQKLSSHIFYLLNISWHHDNKYLAWSWC